MGQLIAECCSNGVQVIVETHSDHVLNGIRISVKNNIVSHTDVRLFFVEKKIFENKCVHNVQEPHIFSSGELDFWPDGFFDEWEKALDELI